MKLVKFLLVAMMLAAMAVASGCKSKEENFVGTWIAAQDNAISKIVVEKHNDAYYMSSTRYLICSDGYNESMIRRGEKTSLQVDDWKDYTQEFVEIKDNTLRVPDKSNIILTYKDDKLSGKINAYPFKKILEYNRSGSVNKKTID